MKERNFSPDEYQAHPGGTDTNGSKSSQQGGRLKTVVPVILLTGLIRGGVVWKNLTLFLWTKEVFTSF